MDKKIEEVVNEQLNTELWSCNLYIAFQVYFEKYYWCDKIALVLNIIK